MRETPQLFGTDGIRGVAGQYPLDRATVWKLGCALGTVLQKTVRGRPPRVLLGEDTRESSSWISRVLAAALESSGTEVDYAGVITTPGVAFLTRHHNFAAGVVVSASHNPYEDNGIKILSSFGIKLSESVELKIERALQHVAGNGANDSYSGREPEAHLLEDYLDYLASLAPDGSWVSRYRLVADCANGAASQVVPKLLGRLGIQACLLNAEPNGKNINLDCGSLHPRGMAEATLSSGADLGVAFDGDADRAIFATRQGRIVDGDQALYAAATCFQARGRLKGGAVVGTVMTNLGLELALASHNIVLKRTAVGDKHVLDEMLRSGINLGGEPSGHVIFSDLSLAGDGILTLLQILRLIVETGKPLEELVRGLRLFPQALRNVRVREKPPLESVPEVGRAIENCRKEFGERGRVVVRYSGTEPLARVMVEGEEEEAVERHAARIAEAIGSAIGLK